MKRQRLINSLPTFTVPVISLAAITMFALTVFYSMANQSMADSSTWTPLPIHPVHRSNETETSQIEPQWRYTRHGWQDANSWAQYENRQHIESPFTNIHPTLWAADVILASLGALVWATDDEKQLRRLLGRAA